MDCCALNSSKGNNCKNKFAHGNGVAIHISIDKEFEGTFINGKFGKGLLKEYGNEIFDGSFVNGIPDGYGICFPNGVPEECRYYKGKRIDTIQKMRLSKFNELQQKQKQLEEEKQKIEIAIVAKKKALAEQRRIAQERKDREYVGVLIGSLVGGVAQEKLGISQGDAFNLAMSVKDGYVDGDLLGKTLPQLTQALANKEQQLANIRSQRNSSSGSRVGSGPVGVNILFA